MYTLIKKLAKLALLVGIALIICGVVSGMMLSDFEKHAVPATAYITTIEEGSKVSNGYKVNLRYTVDGKRYDGSIDSGNLGAAFDLLQSKAEAAGMDVIDYVDNVPNEQKVISIYYNSEIPKSIKYINYKDQGNDFYTWGGIITGGSLVVMILNSAMKKKREERAAERRLEKKQAKMQGK